MFGGVYFAETVLGEELTFKPYTPVPYTPKTNPSAVWAKPAAKAKSTFTVIGKNLSSWVHGGIFQDYTYDQAGMVYDMAGYNYDGQGSPNTLTPANQTVWSQN